jgi:hypothetical protein
VVGALCCYQAIWGESFENILVGTPSVVLLVSRWAMALRPGSGMTFGVRIIF